ncbi:MAG: GAF domain-containing protein [Anaerolineae bacterium]
MQSMFPTLRLKIIGSIIAATAIVLLLFYIPMRQVLIKSYAELEEQNVSRDVQRAVNQALEIVEDLKATAADYAGWDDTYFYMETHDQAYIDSNYNDTTYTNNQLNVIMLIDTSGKVVYAGAYDLNNEVFIPPPERLLRLGPDDPLLTPIHSEQGVEGFLVIGNQPMAVAAQPILTSNSEGPTHGALIMARFLDEDLIAYIAKSTQLTLEVADIADPNLALHLQAARDRILASASDLWVEPVDQQTIAGYALLNDIYGNPAVILHIDTPREVYVQGRTTLTYLGAAIILAGVAFSVVMWWVLRRLVFARLSNFRADVSHIGIIGSAGDFSSRVPVQGEDELSQLSATVNIMLDNLEQYQKELLIQKQRFENLVAVARATVERPDLETTLKNAVEAARAITRAERGSVFILDELGMVTYSILARDDVSNAERQKVVGQVMDIGLAGWVARHRQAALVTDTEQDPRWFPLPDIPYVVRSALVVPIFSGPRKLGILTLTHPEVGHFNQDDLELMQAAADQMALAIRNAQIYDDQRRLAERQTTLYEVLRTIGTLLDPDAVLLVAVDKIAALTNWPVVTILLPDKSTDKLTLRASAGQLPLPEQWSIGSNYGNIGRAFRAGELLYADNTQIHTAGVTVYEKAGSQIVAPLCYGQRTLGILNIEHEGVYAFRADDVVLAKSLADAIALALENAQIHSHVRQYAANLNMMYSLAQVTGRSLDLETILPEALDSILDSLGFEAGFVSLFDPQSGQLQLAATHGIPATMTEQLQSVLNQDTIRDYVAHQHIPMLIEDLSKQTPLIARLQTGAPQLYEHLRGWGIHTYIGTPLVQQGQVLGMIGMFARQARLLSSNDQALQVTLVQHLATAITNTRLFQAVIDERSRLQALIESSSDGAIFIDANQRVPVINAAALKFLALPVVPQEWINRTTLDFLGILRQCAPEAARTLIKELRRVQRADAEPAEGEFEVFPRIIHWYNLPVMAQETALGRLILLHDVTAEHLVERMREDLTRTTIHDLRNPLTSIASAIKLLENEMQETLTPEQHRFLEIADRGTKRMLNLVNSILDISRLEDGQMPLEYTSIDLPGFVEDIIQSQTPLAIDKGLHIESRLPAGLPTVQGDRELLERVFQNLIGNAIKFTPSGGTIHITAREEATDPTRIYISIKDTGAGIPPEIQGRLFKKFTSGKQAGRGSGLGLAFCKMVLNAHQQDIWVEKSDEQGTTFTFTLPKKKH